MVNGRSRRPECGNLAPMQLAVAAYTCNPKTGSGYRRGLVAHGPADVAELMSASFRGMKTIRWRSQQDGSQ